VIDIIDRADHPNLALQFDLYHMAMMGLPLVETYQKHVDRIGHIQFADAPGRYEPAPARSILARSSRQSTRQTMTAGSRLNICRRTPPGAASAG
jgi:sugar phosphate isomerase/epimerase